MHEQFKRIQTPVTNITELLDRELLDEFLLLNGFPVDGSDYERFGRLCVCAQRSPSDPLALCTRAWAECLGCALPVDPEHCAQIWCQTADTLLAGDVPAPAEDLLTSRSDPNLGRSPWTELTPLLDPVTACPPLCGASDWSLWQERAMRKLPSTGAVRMDLPMDYRAVRPNLWRVEQLLRGEITDPACALSQQFDFLCGVCSAERRLYLAYACKADELLALFRWTARRRGGLPPMIVESDLLPERALLATIAALIRTPIGVPPVLCALQKPDMRLPEAICVQRKTV